MCFSLYSPTIFSIVLRPLRTKLIYTPYLCLALLPEPPDLNAIVVTFLNDRNNKLYHFLLRRHANKGIIYTWHSSSYHIFGYQAK